MTPPLDVDDVVAKAASERLAILPMSAEGVATARAAAEVLARGRRSIELRVSEMGAWRVEELAALLLAEIGIASAPREDVAGLVDAAGDALRAANVGCVVFLEGEGWLTAPGGALRRWMEGAEATSFLVCAEEPAASSSSPGDIPAGLTRSERDVLAALTSVPTAVPLRWLSPLFAFDVGQVVLSLHERDLVHCAWAEADLVIDVSRHTRRLVAQASLEPGREERVEDALGRAACADVDALGQSHSLERMRSLMRLRALVRHLYERWRSRGHPQTPALALALLAAMDGGGSTISQLEVTSAALSSPAADPVARAALELRRALLLRALGRGDEAADQLISASAGLDELPAMVSGHVAVALGLLATPERDRHDLRTRARELRARLDVTRPIERAIDARGRAAAAWSHGSAKDALAAALDGLSAYAWAGDDAGQLEMLALAAIYAVGVDTLAVLGVIDELERRAQRAGRTDMEARARGLRGCALFERGRLQQAEAELTHAIDRLSEAGFHHFERWHRAHRGFVRLEQGRLAESARDFDDFVAMSDALGGAPLFGVLGGVLAGSSLAASRVATLRGPPDFARAIVELVLETRDLPSAERAARASAAVASQPRPSPPGFYAFELRALVRALTREPRTAATAAAPRRLLVADDTSWFALDQRASVSLRRAQTLRRLLAGFVAAATQRRALGVTDLFAIGWPGEKASRTSIANRVHVAVCRLRTAGLQDVLVYRDGGWALDPDVEVLLSPASDRARPEA